VGARVDDVGGCTDGEGQGEIRRGHTGGAALRPLDEPEAPGASPFAKSERLELGRITQPIEIDVKHSETCELVELEECVRGTTDRARDADGVEKPPREGGLAGAELTLEIDHRERLGSGPRVCQTPAELLGRFCGLSLEVHERVRG